MIGVAFFSCAWKAATLEPVVWALAAIHIVPSTSIAAVKVIDRMRSSSLFSECQSEMSICMRRAPSN
jgi:hypothetical protein